MDQPGTPEEPTTSAEEAPAAAAGPPGVAAGQPGAIAVPIRDSALGALGVAAPVLLRPAFLWAPIVMSVLLTLPMAFILPEAFVTGAMSGRQLTQAEAREFFTNLGQQMGPFVMLSFLETLLFLPFVTVIVYRLAFDFLDGRPADPLGGELLRTALRMLGSTLVTMAVFGAFLVAGGLIFTVLVISGAVIFLLVLLPILAVLATIVFLRLLPVSPLVVQGRGAIESVQVAWSMSDGHVLRIARWGLVIWLASLAGGIAAQTVTQAGTLVLPARVAFLLAAIVQGPLQLFTAIMLTMLVRLLQYGPAAAAPVRSVGPDWGAPPPPPV